MFARDSEGQATIGGMPIAEALTAAECGTPAYLYDLDAIRSGAAELRAGFGAASHLVAYAAKANCAGPILRAVFAEGCGADVVSGGELDLVQRAGLAPDKIVFSGVAKRNDEIDAALGAGPRGILAVQVESVEEIGRVAARARALGRRARVSIRINPSIAFDAHAHVATGHDQAKFGIALGDLGDAWQAIDAHPELELVGLSSHIGSTQSKTGPYLAAAAVLFDVGRTRERSGSALQFIDAGGGFGIDYGHGAPPVAPAEFARGLVAAQRDGGLAHWRLMVEPGRALVGAHGHLVASVIQTKVSRSTGRRWLMIDAGMNDLLRPALYQARHRIEALSLPPGRPQSPHRVVGPICESADDFGLYDLPLDPAPDAVVIRDAGAYGFTMASWYNGRPLPAEVFVSDGRVVDVLSSQRSAWIESRLGSPGMTSRAPA
jgi:diaminopimelate decarboxylase